MFSQCFKKPFSRLSKFSKQLVKIIMQVFIPQGHLFGEVRLLSASPSSATVVCTGAARGGVVHRANEWQPVQMTFTSVFQTQW